MNPLDGYLDQNNYRENPLGLFTKDSLAKNHLRLKLSAACFMFLQCWLVASISGTALTILAKIVLKTHFHWFTATYFATCPFHLLPWSFICSRCRSMLSFTAISKPLFSVWVTTFTNNLAILFIYQKLLFSFFWNFMHD